MADYIHLNNLIQGEVLRINERRPLEQRPDDFSEMIKFLEGQIIALTIARLKATQELSEG